MRPLFIRFLLTFFIPATNVLGFSPFYRTGGRFTAARSIGRSVLAGANDAHQGDKTTKAELFARWMTSDSPEEVPHPGIKLEVQGVIPKYVRGKYIKNGPGAFRTPDGLQRYTHAFDGLAKLQKYDISNGEVKFTTRFLRGKFYESIMEQGRIPGGIYIGPTEPTSSILERLVGSAIQDNACVSLADISGTGTFVATTDAAIQMQFDPETLETIKLRPKPRIEGVPVLGSMAMFTSAHGKTARKDGRFYNYFTEQNFLKGGAVRIHMVRTNPDLSHTSIGYVDRPDGRIPYIHEISVTENYAILVLYPFYFQLVKSFTTDGCLMKNLVFDPDTNAEIYVFDLSRDNVRDGAGIGPIANFKTQAFFAYHHVNAYEVANTEQVILDVLGYEDGRNANSNHAYLYMDNMMTAEDRSKQERAAAVWRFEMDLSEEKGTYVVPQKKIINDDVTGLPRCLELATVDSERLGRPYRFAYGFSGYARGDEGGQYMDWALVKQDVSNDDPEKGKHGIWFQEFMYPSEPIFVADPNGREEDDGVLLTTAYDSKRAESFLLVVRASDMKELARAYTGITFPNSLHGKFFPSASHAP